MTHFLLHHLFLLDCLVQPSCSYFSVFTFCYRNPFICIFNQSFGCSRAGIAVFLLIQYFVVCLVVDTGGNLLIICSINMQINEYSSLRGGIPVIYFFNIWCKVQSFWSISFVGRGYRVEEKWWKSSEGSRALIMGKMCPLCLHLHFSFSFKAQAFNSRHFKATRS